MNIGYFYKEGLVQALHLTSDHLFFPALSQSIGFKPKMQTWVPVSPT